MNKRRPAQALAVSLCCLQITTVTAQSPTGQPPTNQSQTVQAPTGQAPIGQTTTDRSPRVVLNSGFLRGEFRPGFVSSPDFRDSTRIGSLVRAGQLYLSLEDAIALALENNLDLELE